MTKPALSEPRVRKRKPASTAAAGKPAGDRSLADDPPRQVPVRPPSLGFTLAAALGHSEPLTGLMQRMRQSKQRLTTVSSLLPPELLSEVRAGPLDDQTWILLATHAAAAAKLRQWMPTLTEALTNAGWREVAVRIKVLPRGG